MIVGVKTFNEQTVGINHILRCAVVGTGDDALEFECLNRMANNMVVSAIINATKLRNSYQAKDGCTNPKALERWKRFIRSCDVSGEWGDCVLDVINKFVIE